MLWRYAANSNYIVRRSNGSVGADTYLANNDVVGYVNWQAFQSSGVYPNIGRIGVESDGTHSNNSMPTRLILGTTPLNSIVMLERLRLDNQGIFMLSNNNTMTYPGIYSSTGGGAISWNLSGGNGEVDIWNNASAGSLRGFSFRQMTSTSASTELMRLQSDGGIFGKFRTVTSHNFNIPSGGYTANSGYVWFPAAGGEAENDNVTTASVVNNYPNSTLMPYNGRVVAVIIRVDFDSNPAEELKGRIAVDRNGTVTTSSLGVNLNQGGTGTYTLPTTGYSFSRGDRVVIGVNLVNNAACTSGTCWVEDNNFWVTVIWEYDMQD